LGPITGGRPTLADDRNDFAAALRIHEHQRFAAQAVEVLFDDAADQQRRDPGIESVAAAHEDLEGRRGRQRMARGNSGVGPHHQRALGGPGRGAPKRTDHQHQ